MDEDGAPEPYRSLYDFAIYLLPASPSLSPASMDLGADYAAIQNMLLSMPHFQPPSRGVDTLLFMDKPLWRYYPADAPDDEDNDDDTLLTHPTGDSRSQLTDAIRITERLRYMARHNPNPDSSR